ncbi:MAG: class I SAM-dependent methyltransferase [Methylovulum sp.]|uniref:class I SAM-dependent methyltransferase n=1 Tax=Methylovulum sp. TaxID=1916980 RepID=UPI00261CC2E9|nr:class I SAM-dependent methyltransferase [Methylovulum sp.]MDD2725654.1 class I SAM-dependent methyltransferase [Methylovulum sp.]MDD5126178.1 class I SAM-dependent methyltransferase [Methylovulum sp.]
MKPEDIGQAYNQITHLWESDDFNRSNGIIEHERVIAFVKNRGKALDVGCGCTGRFIDLLLSNGFDPEGVDISEKMIGLAKKRHPEINFYQQDICSWNVPQKYDFITAWDSIWHIPLNQQENVLTKLVSNLNANGVLIFSFGGTDEQGDHKDSFMGPEVYYSTLGINGFLKLFISLGCICRHLEYAQYPELHMYLIVQKA